MIPSCCVDDERASHRKRSRTNLGLGQTSNLKAGFHMIADRRSQIAIRSAMVCDHMETTSAIVCDPAIAIADDRRR